MSSSILFMDLSWEIPLVFDPGDPITELTLSLFRLPTDDSLRSSFRIIEPDRFGDAVLSGRPREVLLLCDLVGGIDEADSTTRRLESVYSPSGFSRRKNGSSRMVLVSDGVSESSLLSRSVMDPEEISESSLVKLPLELP